MNWKLFTSPKPLSLDLGLLILRVFVFGTLLINHGWFKFNKIISGNLEFGDPIGLGQELSLVLAGFAEFIGAILVVIGLFTRSALVLIGITMAVVFFVVHGADGFGDRELPFVYLIASIALFLTGPGKYSLDRK